jgi:hypothetical protein
LICSPRGRRRGYTAWRAQGLNNNQWASWYRLGGLTLPPGTPITALSKAPNQLDLFAVGADGGVYSTWWVSGLNNNQYAQWYRIGGLTVPTRSEVIALSRVEYRIDLFVEAADQEVYTASWNPGVNNNQWVPWAHVGGMILPPNVSLSGLVRDSGRLDLFWVLYSGQLVGGEWGG